MLNLLYFKNSGAWNFEKTFGGRKQPGLPYNNITQTFKNQRRQTFIFNKTDFHFHILNWASRLQLHNAMLLLNTGNFNFTFTLHLKKNGKLAKEQKHISQFRMLLPT